MLQEADEAVLYILGEYARNHIRPHLDSLVVDDPPG